MPALTTPPIHGSPQSRCRLALTWLICAAFLAACSDEDSSSNGDTGGGDAGSEVGEDTRRDTDPDTPSDTPSDTTDTAQDLDDDAVDVAEEVPGDADLDGEDTSEDAGDATDTGDAADTTDAEDATDTVDGDVTDAGDVGSDATPIDCEAQDAEATGDCEIALGWAWDGELCVPLSGCDCAGEDCGAVYEDRADCEEDYAACYLSSLSYELLIFAPPGDLTYGYPVAINENAVIAGSTGPEPFSGVAEAMYLPFEEAGITLLPVEEPVFGYAHGVNEAGDLVGENAFQPIAWIDGEAVEMTVPDGFGSAVPRDISDNGFVVGSFADYDDPLGEIPPGPRPCYWPDVDSAPVPLTSFEDSYPLGYGAEVGPGGQIFGTLLSPDDGYIPVIWADEAADPEPLSILEGAIISEPGGFNASGDAVGRSGFEDFHSEAFFYRRGRDETTSLPYLPDFTAENPYAEARDINDHGAIVGLTSAPGGGVRAVIWFGGEVLDLNDAIIEVPEGVRFVMMANVIDNQGRIGAEVLMEGVDVDVPRYIGVLVPVNE